MKKIALLLLVIISGLCFSQTVELEKLSAGKLVSGSALYDRDNDDLYGYLYFFEKDKVSKTENLYEYVLLDRNLNKVCSGEFKENLLCSDWSSSMALDFVPVYRNGFISIGLCVKYKNAPYSNPYRYRLLDVKENKISESFALLPDLTKDYQPTTNKKLKDLNEFAYYPNSFGYYLYTPIENWEETKKLLKISKENASYYSYRKQVEDSRKDKIYFINEKLEPLWSYSFNNKEEFMAEKEQK